jgi:hypothetical protein
VRKTIWTTTLFAGLVVVSPAAAQKGSPTFGPPIIQTTNKVVDLGTAAVPTPPPPTTTSPFSFSNFLAKIPVVGRAQRTGVSPLPTPASFPSTHYKNAFKPVLPMPQN